MKFLENYKINHESTKEINTMGKPHFKQINSVVGPEKDRHRFEYLSKKIIGAAIEVHRELARPPRLSEPLN